MVRPYLPPSTAASDFLAGQASGVWQKKTLAETATILQAVLDHGSIQGLGDDDHLQYLNRNLPLTIVTDANDASCYAYGVTVKHLGTPYTNAPSATDGILITLAYSSSYAQQRWHRISGPDTYVRNRSASVWGSWFRVWDADADGAGSGLDADKVDTFHASQAPTAGQIPALDANQGITLDTYGVFLQPSSGDAVIAGPPSGGSVVLASNLYKVGNDWYRKSTGAQGMLVSVSNDGTVKVYVCSAGSNPVAAFDVYNGTTVWHSGNDGSSSGLDADTLDGQHAGGNVWPYIPTVGSDGVTELGSVIDFHEQSGDVDDYDARLSCSSGIVRINGNVVWHAGNDGPSSGLDADTLDGYSPSATPTAGQIPVTDGIGDLYIPRGNKFRSGSYTGFLELTSGSEFDGLSYGTPAITYNCYYSAGWKAQLPGIAMIQTFGEGSHGIYWYYAASADEAITWKDYAARWRNVTYDAANFSAGGSQTWTVEAGDQIVYRYKYLAKDTMIVQFIINNSSVGGTTGQVNKIKIPDGKTATVAHSEVYRAIDNGTSVVGTMQTSTTWINLYASIGGAGWAASTNNSGAEGNMIISVS